MAPKVSARLAKLSNTERLQMLFTDATNEQKNEIAREVNEILIANGAKKPKFDRISYTTSRPTRQSIHGGITYKWNADFTELTITRWADGDSFAPNRIINAGIYQNALTDAGIITELRNKKILVITGKADA